MAGATYVAIPTDRLLAAISAMGLPTSKGQQGRELVVDIHLPEAMNVVRVYTSVTVGASEVRETGVDAVRIVVGLYGLVDRKFFPIHKSATLKRTAPRDGNRVLAWISRFSAELAQAIQTAQTKKALMCPKCYNPMVVRKRWVDGKPFLGCVAFPKCKMTYDVPEGY